MMELHKLQLPLGLQFGIFAVLFVAFAMLLPLAPFHVWFARIERRDRLAAQILVTALLVKIGSYGLLRISLPVLPDASRVLAPYLVWVAAGAACYAAYRLFQVQTWGRAIAFLSMVQMALLVCGIFSGNDTGLGGTMLMHAAHAVAMSALLFVVGAHDVLGMHDARFTDLALLPGTAGKVVGALLGVSVLAAVGVPLFGTFTSAWFMTEGLSELAGSALATSLASAWFTTEGLSAPYAIEAMVVPALMVVTLAALSRLCWLTLRRPPVAALPRTGRGKPEYAAALALLLLSVAMGVYPAPFLDRLRVSAHHVVSHVNPAAGNAAECDTMPTPETLSATPGSQFLSAVPCGPDGQPLPASTLPE
jgi:NADH-quinone oxidoreductase subunit M